MKKIIVLFLLLNGAMVYCQDSEPNQWEFFWGNNTTKKVFDPDSFQQSGILTGFQWANSTRMNNALYHTGLATGTYTIPDTAVERPLDLIIQPKWYDGNGYNPGYFGAVMMQYEPSLPINSSNKGTILRPDDTNDPLFGFQFRKGTILNNPLDEDYSRLILYKDSSYAGDTVLKDIWPIATLNTNEWKEFSGQTDNYLGRKWYLTINLKRLNPNIDTLKNNDVVLKIKMPYKRWDNASGYITFNKQPINHKDSIEKLHFILPDSASSHTYINSRGYAQLMQIDTGDVIEITKNMLPIYNDSSESITISAEFHTNDSSNTNPKFSKDELVGKIKEYDIEVEYVGGVDIAIDYIRLEEFNAHLLVRGEIDWIKPKKDHEDHRGFKWYWPSDAVYDTTDNGYNDSNNVWVTDTLFYTEGVNDIYNIIQSSLDHVKDKTNDWELAKLFRFYFQDTENDGYHWWGALRYVNKFSNGMFITRDGIKNADLYYYHTLCRNKWLGVGFTNYDRSMPVPYSYNGKDTYKTMGLKNGYKESGGGIKYPDSLASDYEIHLDSAAGVTSWDDLVIDSVYFSQIGDTTRQASEVFQAKYENGLYYHYYADTKNNFLYSDKPWYFYELLTNFKREIQNGTDTFYLYNHYRTKTFEELTLARTTAIINGCKGFFADGDHNRLFYDNSEERGMSSGGSVGIGDNTQLNSSNDIYSNLVGDDFVNAHNTWNADYGFDKALISSSMKVPEDRIYLGTKSIRDFMFQTSVFLYHNSDELMKLRLAATLSKGYRLLYDQDEVEYGTDTLLTNFISIDTNKIYSSRIKKNLFDTMLDEPFDSTFINMTLLRNVDADLDSVFYIGIQNRRTDPLVYWTNPDSPSQKYLRFLSSAEFRDSCINSPDSLLYQDYWWKRLGARKVTIPFNYTYSDTNTYNLLRISELGSDVDSLNELWHRGEKYYDMVTDTVIGQNRSLSFNLLPGQGKILKVEVLKSDTVAGFLNNYNQTKLISYEDPTDSNMIRYHLVFHKLSPNPADTTNMRTEVQYIQSLPIEKNSLQENIEWNRGTRRNLSDMFWTESADTVGRYQYPNCNNPSIVVRDSGNVQYAYVVYTCMDSLRTNADSSRVIYAKINSEFAAVSFNDEIYHTPSNDIYEYGTPVINASANGNYIAWTDSTTGLLVGYDDLTDSQINKIDTIENTHFALVNPVPIKFPSFHSYSHIENGEDNAGLVWYQEANGLGAVYYSRVKEISIPPNDTLLWSNLYNFDVFYSANGIPEATDKAMVIASGVEIETKPIIFRSLNNYDSDPAAYCIRNRIDNINWLDKNSYLNKFAIGSFTIYHRDTNHINEFWGHSDEHYAYSDDTVSNINSAQQDGISIGGTYSNIGGDFNINYTLGSNSIYQEPGYYGSLFFGGNELSGTEVDYVTSSPTKAAIGKNVHLAKSPEVNLNAENNMWKNRRVFETSELDEYDNPIIHSSANLFYKSAFDNKIVKHGLYGFTSDSNNVYFDLPVLEGEFEPVSSEPYGVSANFDNTIDPCINFETPSTRSFMTDFLVHDIQLEDDDNDGDKEMQLTMYGHKNDDIKVFLMRNSDSTTMALTTPSSTTYPSNGTKLIYSILDSTGSTFTLIYEKQDTLALFTEKSFLGGLSTDDTVSYKSTIAKDPVKYILDFDSGANFEANNSDLLDLSVYPNPVSNVLTIQAILPEELNGNRLKNTLLELSITDITGRTILKQTVASGQIVTFDMSNQSNGVYNVKMRYTGSNQFESVRKIIKK